MPAAERSRWSPAPVAPPGAATPPTTHQGRGWGRYVALVVGAALVATTAGIHLALWLTSYGAIPTIGPLFLFQAVAGAALAAAVVVSRHVLVVLAAAAFLVATAGGFLLSVWVGLFGFQDTLAAPLAQPALAVEAAGAAVLGLAAVTCRHRARGGRPERTDSGA